MVNLYNWTCLGLLFTVAICLQFCDSQTNEPSQNIQLSSKTAKSLLTRFLAKFSHKSKTSGKVEDNKAADLVAAAKGQNPNIVTFKNYLRSDQFCSFEHVVNFLDFVGKNLKRTMVTDVKLKQTYTDYIDLIFEACSQILPRKIDEIFSESFEYLEQPWYSSVYGTLCEFIYHNDPSQNDQSHCVINRRRNDSFLDKLLYSEDDFFAQHVESYLKHKVETTGQKVEDVWLELKQAVEGVFYSNRNSVTPLNLLVDAKNNDEELAEVYHDSAIISLIELDFVAARLVMVDVIASDTGFEVKMATTFKFDDSSPYSWPTLQMEAVTKYRVKINKLL